MYYRDSAQQAGEHTVCSVKTEARQLHIQEKRVWFPRPMRRGSMDKQVNHSHGALLPGLWPLDSFLVSVSTLDWPRVTKDSDSLYTDAESNPKTILGEVEEESFLIYQTKGDTPGLCLERVRCSTPGN